tara:strand:- start:9274 stop:10071 length:798 start_codon:yes stop_codon:yes gene_type:complete
MANYQSVTVSENTNEENISLEKQAAMQEEAAQQRGQTLESSADEGTQEVEETSERPEWLDEKFENPEDLAKAYNELQQKQSTKKDSSEEQEQNTEEDTPQNDNAVTAATTEFTETGQLSDETFLSLEKSGIPREMVEAYMRGQEAVSVASATEIQNSIGGVDNYNAMSEWAGETLEDGDLTAYNAIVESGTVEQARVAVKGMYAQFLGAGGKAPELAQGTTSGVGGSKAFGSAASMVEAMQDPRYKSDPAYRTQVEKRIAVSNAF